MADEPQVNMALIGQTIGERYRIERVIGVGGTGAVYQAEHTLMRKRMAIKVLHPEMTRRPEVVARFEREAMAAAHIDHPHVVAATDFGKLEDGSFFLALEFVEGNSLRDVIGEGKLEVGRALHIGHQIASALSRAHALKIVHRDLKPENVMLVERDGDPNFVKVLDFGIAKVQIGELTEREPSADPGQIVLTQAGMIYGTPEYMAPEQALGQPVDARADLYALGIILYEMLTGLRPFDAPSAVAVLGMQVTVKAKPMAQKNPQANLPPEVELLVQQLLAKEITARISDAKEVMDRIRAIQTELAPVRSIANLLAGKSWLLAAGAGMLGILVLVVTIASVRKGPSTESTDATSSDAALLDAASQASVDVDKAADKTVDEQVTDAIAMIDRGDYASGIKQIEQLGDKAAGRQDVHRALLTAYSSIDRPKDAMREAGAVLKMTTNLDVQKDVKLRVEVRGVALMEGDKSNKPAVDEAFLLLENHMGTVGWEDLYDIAYGTSGVQYPKAGARAKVVLQKADRTKMTPALSIAVDLQAAGMTCRAKKLFDRAQKDGDYRTLALLKQLQTPRYWGRGKKHDALGCIHEGSLNKTIAVLEERLRSRRNR